MSTNGAEFWCSTCGHEVREHDDTCTHCGALTRLRTPQEIWGELSRAEKRVLLRNTIYSGNHTLPDSFVIRVRGRSTLSLTPIGRAVAEYGRGQS